MIIVKDSNTLLPVNDRTSGEKITKVVQNLKTELKNLTYLKLRIAKYSIPMHTECLPREVIYLAISIPPYTSKDCNLTGNSL